MESMTNWDDFRKSIATEFRESPNHYLKRPTIRLTVCPYQSTVARDIANYLGDWMSHIKEPERGQPTISHNNRTVVTYQQIYYHKMMNERWGKNNFESITDIGGGYGACCRIHKTNGHTGEYYIIDFVEMHDIQMDHLIHTSDTNNVYMKDLRDDYPTTELLNATFSLNEMPLVDRSVVIDRLPEYDKIFIAHNREYEGIDNIEYFKRVAKDLRSTHTVEHFPCPIYNKAWYLIASRN